MIDAIFAVLLSFPAHTVDVEPLTDRQERLRVIATAITHAAERATCVNEPEGCRALWPGEAKALSAYLLTVGWFESNWSVKVHSGERLGDKGRAIGLWQQHRNARLSKSDWQALAGTNLEATTQAALEATRTLAGAYLRCRRRAADAVSGTFAAYATGGACSWAGATRRTRLYHSIFSRLSVPPPKSAPEKAGGGQAFVQPDVTSIRSARWSGGWSVRPAVARSSNGSTNHRPA